jgi:hypothetical protein
MPFDVKNLNRNSHLGTFGTNAPNSLWTYVTEDTHAVVIAAGYFNAQAQFFRKGDVIHAVTSLATATPVYRLYVVTATTATTVTIAAILGSAWT